MELMKGTRVFLSVLGVALVGSIALSQERGSVPRGAEQDASSRRRAALPRVTIIPAARSRATPGVRIARARVPTYVTCRVDYGEVTPIHGVEERTCRS